MNKGHDSTAAGLLRCFFSESGRKFRFLEQKHGFECISGLAEYKNAYRIIRPFSGDQEAGDRFLAMVRYERDGRAFEILYGGADMILEFHSCHHVARFTPAEILAAARRHGGGLSGAQGVAHEKTIEDVLERFSKALGKHPKILIDPPAHILERARSIREKHLEQAIRKHYRQTLERVSRQAAKAYREKDFPKVVRLLEPHKAALCASDLKKLHLARSQMRG